MVPLVPNYNRVRPNRERLLECLLIAICVGLTVLLHAVVGYKMVVLNLFYLPVVLSAFFLGRLRAGTLALLCVLLATVVAALELPAFATNTTPVIIGLSLTVWAAVMGLSAIIAGTLSDERASQLANLNRAYLGVVDVLAQYLNSADPGLHDRAKRVATLGQSVARQLGLSDRKVNDIRVAALLMDLKHVQVTAEVIDRALGVEEENGETAEQPPTFEGQDFVQSLGPLLDGTLPLITGRHDPPRVDAKHGESAMDVPLGAAILAAAYHFDSLVCDPHEPLPPHEALGLMESELNGEFHPAVLRALRDVVGDLPVRAVDRLSAIERLVQDQD